MSNGAKTILDLIRARQQGFSDLTPEEKERAKLEASMRRCPLTADQWQTFKRDFIEEYGGEKVQADGLTHSELLQYIEDGSRENDIYDNTKSLRSFLKKLDN